MPQTLPRTAPRPSLGRISPRRRDILLAAALCAVFYVLAGHDDLLETSNHAWLLLESIRSGKFLQYYEVVMAHENTLYYLNNAHYNILCYLLYALWQLPVYLVVKLGGLALNEYFLMFWSKAVGTAAYAGCAVLLGRLARALAFSEEDAHWASLYFLLDPIAFLAAILMGQYDALCMVFLLAGLLCWRKGQLWRFAFWAGLAMAFKFFPLLLFLPLLVLVEKRPLRCAGYAAATLWAVVPSALLFRGHTGDMGVFNDLMIDRIFAARLPGGVDVPIFLLLYAGLLLACYFYRPADEAAAARWMPWLGLAVFGGLFLFTEWHPQWLLLVVPFAVLTSLCQRQRAVWLYLENLWFFGFWLTANLHFPGQIEANLFRFGIFGRFIAAHTAAGTHNQLAFYLNLIPRLADLAPVIFAAPLAAAILFKCPVGGRSLADRLADGDAPLAKSPSMRVMLFGSFFLCIVCIWGGTALYVTLKAFGL